MEVEVTSRPAYAMAYVKLRVGESVYAEPGSMVALSAGMEVSVATSGGVTRSVLRKAFAQESFFMARYTALLHGAWVALGPRFPGDIVQIPLDGIDNYNIESGALLAHSQDVTTSARVGNVPAMALREGGTVLRTSGVGSLLVSSYGGIERFDLGPQESIIVDTGHLVAWVASMGLRVGPLSGIVSSQFTGEGLVGELQGPGVVYVQTRAEQQLHSWLMPNRAQNTGRR
jgi:uncharacterized protein (TIGR00266 family)